MFDGCARTVSPKELDYMSAQNFRIHINAVSRTVSVAGLCVAMTASSLFAPGLAKASDSMSEAPLALQARTEPAEAAPAEAAPAEAAPAEAAPAEAAPAAAAPAAAPAAAAPMPAGPPPPKGVGMIVGGALWAGLIGIPLTAWGAIGLAGVNAADDASGGAVDDSGVGGASRGLIIGGCLVPGIIGLLGGGALVAVGAIRLNKYNQWKQNSGYTLKSGAVLAPTVAMTQARTGTYGMSLRF